MAKDKKPAPKAKAPEKRVTPRSGKNMNYDTKAATGKRKSYTAC